MKTRIQKWGNSLALCIPESVALEAGFNINSPVEISYQDGKLIVAPEIAPHYSLEDLLQQITNENLHNEIETGSAVGKEIW